MITAILSLMFLALLAASMAHLAWSFGLTWPLRDEKLLAQTVVGTAGIERMPPRPMTFAVTMFLIAAMVVGTALGDQDSGGVWLTLAGFAFAVVFLCRGIVGYTDWWAARTPEPSFRFNDRRVYSPLCLLLGAGFSALAIMRLL